MRSKKKARFQKQDFALFYDIIRSSEKPVSYTHLDVYKRQVDAQYISAALDEEESSRIESEDGQTLVIIDVPYMEEEQEEKTVVYTTTSIGIILTPANFITVSARETLVIDEFAEGRVKGVQTHLKTRFLLAILLRVAARFQLYLKQIDRLSLATETQLHRSMQNKELFQLLGLEKSLVYFSTSLKSNELTLEKILRGRIIKLYEDDQDLLEDVLIEIKQAIEMCNIYSGILSGTMDAFASIISNNLNIVMKILAAVTIVMAIPNIVFGFYGMNVGGFGGVTMFVPIAVTLILMALSAAKQSGDCCKVVAKINRKSLLELVSTESLIDSVVSTGAVTTELILQYIRAMKNASASKVKTLHRIVDEKVEALEFSVTPDISFAGVPLRDLNLKRGLLLAGIVRQNGQIVIPSGNDVLHLHDDVIVVTTDTQLEDLRDILAE